MSSKATCCHPSHPTPQWPGKGWDIFLSVYYTLNTFFPHLKRLPIAPNSEEAPAEACLVMCSNYRTHHPKLPTAIYPIPPPNGQGKGRLNFFFYTRPCIQIPPPPPTPKTPAHCTQQWISTPNITSGDVYMSPPHPDLPPAPRPPIGHPRHQNHHILPLLTNPTHPRHPWQP